MLSSARLCGTMGWVCHCRCPTYPSSAPSVQSCSRQDTVSLVGDRIGAGDRKYRAAALARNGAIYAPPYGTDAQFVLKFVPSTGMVTTIGNRLGTTASTSRTKYMSAVLAGNGAIYCVPTDRDMEYVLKIEPVADTVTTLGMHLPFTVTRARFQGRQFRAVHPFVGGSKYFAAVLARNGAIYAPPGGESQSSQRRVHHPTQQVLKIEPTTDTVTTVGASLGPGSYKYNAALLSDTGDIYAPPYGAEYVMKIHPATDTVTTLGISLGTGQGKYKSAVSAPNGVIYAVPYGPGAEKVLKIDPRTDTVSTIGNPLCCSLYFAPIIAHCRGCCCG